MEVKVVGGVGVIKGVGDGAIVVEAGVIVVLDPLGADVTLFAHPVDEASRVTGVGEADALAAGAVKAEELSKMYSLFSTSRYA